MTEEQIEKYRWRAQRILRSTPECDGWMRAAAFSLLKETRPGCTPSESTHAKFNDAYKAYFNSPYMPYDFEVTEKTPTP